MFTKRFISESSKQCNFLTSFCCQFQVFAKEIINKKKALNLNFPTLIFKKWSLKKKKKTPSRMIQVHLFIKLV